LHQIGQQIEDLRLHRDQFGAAPEFAPLDIKCMIFKAKLQRHLPRRRSQVKR